MSKAISTFLRLLRSRPRHSKAATIKPKANKNDLSTFLLQQTS